MLIDQVVSIGREALMTTILLAAAPLLVAVIVAVVMSMVQTVTQVQDPAITTVPKIAAVLVTLLVSLPWLMQTMVEFVTQLYSTTPIMIGTG